MTAITINIADDLKQAFEKAYPDETIEAGIERVLRAEIDRRRTLRAPHEVDAILEAFARVQKLTKPLSDDEIRELRHEGRK